LNNHVTLKKDDDHEVLLYWSLSETKDIITIRAEANSAKESWLGIGWGGDDGMMTNADMVIATKKDGAWTVSDYFAYGFEIPTIDDHQDVFDSSAGFSQGKIWMQFSRHLKTDDTRQDRKMKAGPMQLAFAVGFSEKLTNQAHKFAGHQQVTLVNDLDYYGGKKAKDDDEDSEHVIPEPVFLESQFFNREFGSCLPKQQTSYHASKTQFGNFLVQRAKKDLDTYYDHHPRHHHHHHHDDDDNTNSVSHSWKKRLHMYHVAECSLENVQFYSDNSNRKVPCKVETTPIELNKDYTTQSCKK